MVTGKKSMWKKTSWTLDHEERRTASVNHSPAGTLPQRDLASNTLDTSYNLWNDRRITSEEVLVVSKSGLKCLDAIYC